MLDFLTAGVGRTSAVISRHETSAGKRRDGLGQLH